MKYTTVRYAFNVQPSLKKYNCRADYKITQKAVWILFVIEHFGQLRGLSNNEISSYLKRHGHTTNPVVIRKKVHELKLNELITKTESAVMRHKITITGRNVLKAIDVLIRKRSPIVIRRKKKNKYPCSLNNRDSNE